MSNGDDETAASNGESTDEEPADEPVDTEAENDAESEEAATDAAPESDEANVTAPDTAEDGEQAGDDESDDETEAADADEAEAEEDGATADDLNARLDETESDLENAETEADLDEIDRSLDETESDLETVDFPEPDDGDEDEDAEDPRADLEDRISTIREDVEAQRGPYAEDVVGTVENAQTTVEESEWTDSGEEEAHAAVVTFLDASEEYVGHDADAGDDLDAAADALGTVADAVESADLDADDDAETIEGLLEAAETLEDDLEAAEVWDDLTVQEQLDYKGFYDVLTNENRKDFPAEWNAAKIHAAEGNVEMVVFALEKVGSEFMEEYIIDILYNLGSDAEPAFDVMHQRAQKRDKGPIKVLGKIGDDRAIETLHDFIDGDGDAALQKVTLRSLGAIGSPESVQPVANRLDADNSEIRSSAARSLGLLGDTRAIDPLSDVLESDESDEVRASAAWALRQIGTEEAFDEAAKYADDRAYLVQAEAEKATGY
ncbi:HEAT repeat domain-containing protein [Haloarcula amylovorans]|uniref:HEAT repeat domain-containing protein n=1 Tax=Haloarcula amylovorans TaxID=2562280 RepID=UPI001075E42D|nr:HEAT repeat domain-containing protein [Halomicroarcula amylolytica]